MKTEHESHTTQKHMVVVLQLMAAIEGHPRPRDCPCSHKSIKILK